MPQGKSVLRHGGQYSSAISPELLWSVPEGLPALMQGREDNLAVTSKVLSDVFEALPGNLHRCQHQAPVGENGEDEATIDELRRLRSLVRVRGVLTRLLLLPAARISSTLLAGLCDLREARAQDGGGEELNTGICASQ
jgi:hypothetical protein